MSTQLTEEDLARLMRERKYEEVEQARLDGRLDTLQGVPSEIVALQEKAKGTEQLTRDDVRRLLELNNHELIVAADKAGRITYTERE